MCHHPFPKITDPRHTLTQENYSAQFSLGQTFLSQKKYPAAIKCFEVIKNSDQECKELYLILPNLYSRLGYSTQATADFEKAIQYFPKNLRLFAAFAGHLDMCDKAMAAKIYSRILKLLKSDLVDKDASAFRPSIQFYNNMGVTFMHTKRFAEAAKAFSVAKSGIARARREIEGDTAEGCLEYDYKHGKSEKRQKRLLLDSLQQSIRFNEALVVERQGKFHTSLKMWKSILEVNPSFLEARIRLARIYKHFGKGDWWDNVNETDLLLF